MEVSAATGAIGPVLRKLAAFLRGEYKPPPPPEVSRIEFIISKLEEMQSVLSGLWGREDLHTHCKDWMVKARELSYDMEDDIDCFMQRSTTNTSKIFEDLKVKVMDVSGRFCDEWKTAENISNASKPVVDPRGRFLHKDASELVGMWRLKEELIQLLLAQGQCVAKPKPKPRDEHERIEPLQEMGIKVRVARGGKIQSKAMRLTASTHGVESVRATGYGKDLLLLVVGRGVDFVELTSLLRKTLGFFAQLLWVHQLEVEKVKRAEKPVQHLDDLKMVCMVGYAGAGKTALADLLYQETQEHFQCRAFVSVSPTPNITEVLTSILTQVTNSTYKNGTEAVSQQYLIHEISNFLANTRYLVIIDDIWHTKEWEVIKQSLPKNNLSSRIIMTTRSNDIAEKCRSDDIDAFVYEIGVLYTWEAWGLLDDVIMKYVGRFVSGNDEEDYHYNIVKMCYGMPLALICMSSALAEQIQGLGGGELQDLRAIRCVEDGILSILCMKPLADSLCLGYDNLLPPYLRTLLLYCSIYRWTDKFERESLARRWIAEGFVCEGEAARCFFDELVSKEWIKPVVGGKYEIHPMMLAFLRCKSQEDNFIACLAFGSDISSLCTSTRQIRRLSLQRGHSDLLKISKSDLELSYTRSLFVFEDASAVPFKRFQRLRVLELQGTEDLEYAHLVEICELLWLRYIGLEGTPIRELPPEIGKLQRLETLDVRETWIRKLPPEIGKLQRLETLDIRDTKVMELPSEIGGLQHLKTLDIRNTMVRELPPEIGKLQCLKTLDVRNTMVSELPPEIGKLQRLETLDVRNTMVRKLPPEIGGLQHLKTLYIRNMVSELPLEIGKLQRLETLDVRNTMARKLPPEIGELQHLKTLYIRNMVSELPPEIGKLQHLETLGIRNTKVRKLPPEIGGLQHLKTLDIRNTMVSELPPEIGKLERLETLDVRDSMVRKLPSEIGGLQHLKTLDVRNTMVSELPWETGQISNSVRVFAGDMEFNEGVSLPEDICQDRKAKIPESLLAECREVLSILVVFDRFDMGKVPPHVGVFKVPGIRTHIPQLIKKHFSFLSSLDISLCKLDNERGDLKFLQEMPNLQTLLLRLQVLPRQQVTIGNGGFARLESFYVDSRVPRVSFEPGAMPSLKLLTFRFYAGAASEDPAVGITHLQSLEKVVFRCSPWYKSDGLGIAATIAAVRGEAQEHPNRITVCINDAEEVFPQNDAGSSGASGIVRVRRFEIGSSSRTSEIVEEVQEKH